MTTRAIDLAAELAALQARYLRDLRPKLESLADAVAVARARPSAHSLQEARNAAHRIAGTAGSYGILIVSEAIGELEEILCATSDLATLPPERGERVDAQLARALASIAVEPPEPRSVAHAQTGTVAPPSLMFVGSDPTTLATLRELAVRQAARLETVAPEHALEWLRAARGCDAVLLEASSIGGDAMIELVQAIRALPDQGAVPVAVLAAEVTLAHRIAAMHAGASLFVDPPLDAARAAEALELLLRARNSTLPRVLVVDDDEALVRRAASVLHDAGMLAIGVADSARILDVLEDVRPDLLLLDVRMPGVDGLDICRMLRATLRWQHLPIVFLTGLTAVEDRVAAFQCGADDYLPKPVVDEELVARIRVHLDRARLARELAQRDSLTGLWLRSAFLESLDVRLTEARRHRRSLAVCLLDVDSFKLVNDTHGHLTGDRVLAGLGKLLTARFRAEDARAGAARSSCSPSRARTPTPYSAPWIASVTSSRTSPSRAMAARG